jgi:hypothetical protein
MRSHTPTLHCDADDGDCGTWDVDYWATDASSVNGVRITAESRSPGWLTTDEADLCPEHAAVPSASREEVNT